MIHSIRIQNFKSIRDVSVDLSPVTVLVGRSGTGKSNFLAAIDQLKRLVLDGKLQRKWPSHLGKGGGFRFQCRFSVHGYDESFTYQLNCSGGQRSAFSAQLMSFDEKLALGESLVFHQGPVKRGGHVFEQQWLHEPDMINPPNPSGIVLGRLPAMSEAVVAFTTLTNGLGFYDFSDNVLNGKQNNDSSRSRADGLLSNGENYLSVVQSISQDLTDIRLKRSLVETLKRVNPSIESIELDNLQNPSSVVVAHRFHDTEKLEQLILAQESAGVRRFYAHLLALYQKPPKQTLMFEHPEDGIHPGAMSLLAEEFKDCALEGRGQILLTTHNPMLLDHFDAEQIRVVELEKSETKIGPIEVSQQEAIRQDLLDAGELLTTDPARIHKGSGE